MKVVAITGIAGYIGKRLLAALDADPEVDRVIGFDVRPPPEARTEKLTFYQMDIGDPGLADRMRQLQVEVLVHAAFVLYPRPGRLTQMERTNLEGTANVLRAAAQSRVQQLLVFSSTTVYGAWPDNPVPLTEEHPLRPNPDYHYGLHKKRVEAMCQTFSQEHTQVSCTVLRPPAVVGPHLEGPATDMWRGHRAIVVDGGKAPGQFIHEDDLVSLVMRALQSKARGTFNAAPDDWLPWREIWTQVGKPVLDLPWTVARPLVWLMWRLGMLGGVTHPALVNMSRFPFVVSNEKARQELGWRPQYTTVQAIKSFIESGEEGSSQ